MADNTDLQSTTLASLPSGTKVGIFYGTMSGDSNVAVAPTILALATGSEGSWAFAPLPMPATIGANGGLRVDIVGDSGVSTTLDTDDGSVAGGQISVPLVLGLPYTWNGVTWARGGWTPSVTISAASTNATSVKAAAGVVGVIAVGNTNAAARYLKLYNKASAPTVGSDTPVAVFIIPGNTAGAGSNVSLPTTGLVFSTGIAFALTTGAAHTDATAVALNEIQVTLGYL